MYLRFVFKGYLLYSVEAVEVEVVVKGKEAVV
jgi:hypothetical protein